MKPKLFWFACLASLLVVGTAQAEIIQIHVTGLNFTFGGGQIYDTPNAVGGNQVITQADPVETIDFFKDDVFVGRLNTDVYADLLIDKVPLLPKSGGVVTTGSTGGTFGFDLLQGGSSTTQLLGLTFDSLDVFYSKSKVVFVGGDVQQLTAQNLPFGLVLDNDTTLSISISSSNLTSLTYTADNQSVTGFQAFGTGDVSGTGHVVPEPSTLILLGMGVLGLVFLRRRK
jgi:hypothetical protein